MHKSFIFSSLFLVTAGFGCSSGSSDPMMAAMGGTAAGGGGSGGMTNSAGGFPVNLGGMPSGGTASGGTPAASGGMTTGGTSAGGFPVATGGFPVMTGGTGGTTGGSGGMASGGTANGGAPAGGSGGTPAGGSGGAAAGDFPPNCPAPTGTHGTTALTRTCWTVTASDCAATAQNMNPPVQAIDATGATTRYSSGVNMTMSKMFTFQIDLGSAVMVNGISVVSAVTDFAPQLEVSTSMDGTTFTPVACGAGALTTDFSFTAVNAQYIKLVQHGVSAASWWSIHDLNVYAASGMTCAVAGTQTGMCTTPHTQ
ncbi:MAG TPA: discoidin domain-containing protein [Polyangiaceae bacterium]|nr:discoidin domain-containing protein [Polyangiaceae bacterium]